MSVSVKKHPNLLARGGFLACLLLSNPAWSVSPAEALLSYLHDQLSIARSLPPGSRPSPPTRDLAALVGSERASIVSALGTPSACGDDEGDECAKGDLWQYEWGPPAREPQVRSDAAGDVIQMETGGPWLLVIAFSEDRVENADWQGQR